MIKLGIIMDSILSIKRKKDSSLAMLLEAKKREYEIFYMETKDLFLLNNEVYSIVKKLKHINEKTNNWFKFEKEITINLEYLNVILMRKDPPFNNEYLYHTYILEKLEKKGILIINNPKSLRNFNEKLFPIEFPNIIPETIVTKNIKILHKFYKKNNDVILKPLNLMGGKYIFRIKKNDKNLNVILETITKFGTRSCIMQKYVNDIKYGDKRVFIINGNPIKYFLFRVPKKEENRGNLSTGGLGKIGEITKKEKKIINIVSPILKKHGLLIAGLDIIGNYLIEINITSPTCIREIERLVPGFSITKKIFDMIEEKIQKSRKNHIIK
ncbi:glutathione synthetase [Candidatus Riesia sp. GBBU]|nr:glutathione synthetase [Candidatus Riesia sp. GBBU]